MKCRKQKNRRKKGEKGSEMGDIHAIKWKAAVLENLSACIAFRKFLYYRAGEGGAATIRFSCPVQHQVKS